MLHRRVLPKNTLGRRAPLPASSNGRGVGRGRAVSILAACIMVGVDAGAIFCMEKLCDTGGRELGDKTRKITRQPRHALGFLEAPARSHGTGQSRSNTSAGIMGLAPTRAVLQQLTCRWPPKQYPRPCAERRLLGWPAPVAIHLVHVLGTPATIVIRAAGPPHVDPKLSAHGTTLSANLFTAPGRAPDDKRGRATSNVAKPCACFPSRLRRARSRTNAKAEGGGLGLGILELQFKALGQRAERRLCAQELLALGIQ